MINNQKRRKKAVFSKFSKEFSEGFIWEIFLVVCKGKFQGLENQIYIVLYVQFRVLIYIEKAAVHID